jgi:hypothetical protein
MLGRPRRSLGRNIAAILTVCFFHNGSEIGCIQWLQKPQIHGIFEKHKGTAVFQGFGRSLDAAVPPKPVASLGVINADARTPDTLRDRTAEQKRFFACISDACWAVSLPVKPNQYEHVVRNSAHRHSFCASWAWQFETVCANSKNHQGCGAMSTNCKHFQDKFAGRTRSLIMRHAAAE